MRVAVKGADDAVELRRTNDTWVSEAGEAVEVIFEWQKYVPRSPVAEADCICAKEFAANLLELLARGDADDVIAIPVVNQGDTSLSPHVI